MASTFDYIVVLLDPRTGGPMRHVDIEAFKESDGTSMGVVRTDDRGFAKFNAIADQARFHARVAGQAPSYQVVMSGGPGSGLGPFEHDILVDANWATVVAAGQGTEGQQFTAVNGLSFGIVSTIQRAWDGVGDTTGAKNFTSDCSVLIVAGGDIGQLDADGDNGSDVSRVIFSGSSADESVIPGTLSVHAVDIDQAVTKTIVFQDIGIAATDTVTKSLVTPAGAGQGPALEFHHCIVGSRLGFGPVIGDNVVRAWDTQFLTNQAGEFSLDMNDNLRYSQFHDCTFDDRVRAGSEAHLFDCTHNIGVAAIGIVGSTAAGSKFLDVVGSDFHSGAGAWNHYIDIGGSLQRFKIRACTSNGDATVAIKVHTSFNTDGVIQAVVGNYWDCELGLDNQTTTAMILNYSGNSHAEPGGSPALTATPIIVQGKFNRSEFSGNGPAGSRIDLQTGSELCRINGMLIDITNTGAPSHTANQGSLYLDADSNTLYINTDGSTTWAILGIPGGGASAPSDAQYLVLAADGDLANERVFTPGTALSAVDSGAGAAYTVSHAQVSSGDLHQDYPLKSILTAQGSIYAASGASTPAELAIGANATILQSDGTDPAWVAPATAIGHAILDGSIHTDSVADAVTAGSIIIGNDTPKWDELVISVPNAGARNVLAIDNGETVPSWKVNNLLADTDGDTSVLVEKTADEDIIHFNVAGVTDVMTIADHGVDIHTTADANDEHALEMEVDAAGFGDVKAIDVVYTTGALATGEEDAIVLLNIDELDATGGDIFGVLVLSTEGGVNEIFGYAVGPGIGPMHQDSGTFVNPTTGTNNTASTDVPDMIDGSEGTNTTIFVADNDFIIIGAAAAFTAIEFDIETPASQPGIKPTFAYSTSGSGNFTTFSPIDGTNGFRNTGIVTWEPDELTGHAANSDTGTFDIKITRTHAVAGSVSLFFAKTATTVVFTWDKDGRVFIKGQVVGHTAQIAAGGVTGEFQVLGNGFPDSVALIGMWNDSILGSGLNFMKTRQAGGVAAHDGSGIVADNDHVGTISWYPDDGVDFDTQAALFRGAVDDASPAAGDIGMAFVWEQMPGGGGARRETMRLDAAADLRLVAAGSIILTEKSGSTTAVSTEGQLWVKSDTPSAAYFTDDADTDFEIALNLKSEVPVEIAFPLADPIVSAADTHLTPSYEYKNPWVTGAARRMGAWYVKFESNVGGDVTLKLQKNGTDVTGASVTISSGTSESSVDSFTEFTLAAGDTLEVEQTTSRTDAIQAVVYVYGYELVVPGGDTL